MNLRQCGFGQMVLLNCLRSCTQNTNLTRMRKNLLRLALNNQRNFVFFLSGIGNLEIVFELFIF